MHGIEFRVMKKARSISIWIIFAATLLPSPLVASAAVLVNDPAWFISGNSDSNRDGRPDSFWENFAADQSFDLHQKGLFRLKGAFLTRPPARRKSSVLDHNTPPRTLWIISTTGNIVVPHMRGRACPPPDRHLTRAPPPDIAKSCLFQDSFIPHMAARRIARLWATAAVPFIQNTPHDITIPAPFIRAPPIPHTP
jgi:hypothetical protein